MPHANSRNKFDKKDSLELGERAEARFAVLAGKLGWRVSASAKAENIDEHWDFLIEKEALAYRVEVKSRKRVSREEREYFPCHVAIAARLEARDLRRRHLRPVFRKIQTAARRKASEQNICEVRFGRAAARTDHRWNCTHHALLPLANLSRPRET